MRSLTCIVCPMGCSLKVEEGPLGSDGFATLTITGNNCSRGVVYAQEEIRCPKRVLTATCAIAWEKDRSDMSRYATRRIPVKTALPCPKEKINELLADIYKTRVPLPISAGDIVLADWQGTGINVIAVRTVS